MKFKLVYPSIFVAITALSGCGLFSSGTEEPEPPPRPQKSQRLGEVYFAPLPLDHTPLEEPDTQTMRDAYQALLTRVADNSDTKKIVHLPIKWKAN